MPVKGNFGALASKIKKLREVENGAAARVVSEEVRKRALALVLEGWNKRESPAGKSWPAGKSGAGSLEKSGKMRQALEVKNFGTGIAITDAVRAPNEAFYGGTHQYGRIIRAKGVTNYRYKVFKPDGSVVSRAVRGKYRTAGVKPLRWQTADGQWHRAFTVKVPARPIVPPTGQLPPKWNEAFRECTEGVLKKLLND